MREIKKGLDGRLYVVENGREELLVEAAPITTSQPVPPEPVALAVDVKSPIKLNKKGKKK